MQSKVSMVMPCYNKVEYIGDMFESIIVQKWDNIELILVNDGSIDGTREVISQYKPKFINRGYDVVIIDQENAGVCAAAKAGFERITGDYVCIVDADDELDPRYVSSMAGWLDSHSEDDFTACGFQTYTIQDGNKNFEKYYSQPLSERRNDRINLRYYLLANISMGVWVYMVRVSYLKKSMVIDNFYTATRGSHEPGYIIPILSGGGKAKFIDLPLYKFNILEESHSKTKQYSKFVDHWKEYERLLNIALDHLPSAEKKQLQRCFKVMKYRRQIAEYNGDSPEVFNKVVCEATEFLNNLDFTRICFDADNVRDDYDKIFSKVKVQLRRRVIGYGAKGKAAEQFIPEIMGTKYEPTELWDANTADDETHIYGLPLHKPEFDRLKNTDLVIVFVKKPEIVKEIRKNLLQCIEPVTVIFSSDFIHCELLW